MIIAVANQKGGVGKTTTSAALAVNLGKLGKKVLVVDVDPQANCTTMLGVASDTVGDRPNMFTVFEDIDDIERTFIDVAHGVTLAPSHISLAYCDRTLNQQIDRERVLARKLKSVADRFDFILLDSPPSLGVFAFNVLAACDTVLVPIQSEPLALDGINLLLDSLEDVRKFELNPKCDVGGVVLTMFDTRRNIDKRVKDMVRDIFPEVVFGTTIPRDVRLVELTENADLSILDGESNAAVAYRNLAKEVISRWKA